MGLPIWTGNLLSARHEQSVFLGAKGMRLETTNMQPNPSVVSPSLSARVTETKTTDRIERLEKQVQENGTRQSRTGRKWRNRFAVTMVALVAVSALAAAAITTANTNFSAAKSDVYVYDESMFTIVSQGMDVTAIAVSAAGTTSGAAIEMAPSLGAANVALSAGDWFYEIDLKEAGIGSVASGTYRAELFVDGTSKGSLYITQATADATAIEGVALKWSLGASLSANSAYVVKVVAA